MHRLSPQCVTNLMTAAGAGGGDDRDRIGAQGGKQFEFCDALREIIMIARVAERAGHAAAAGVEDG